MRIVVKGLALKKARKRWVLLFKQHDTGGRGEVVGRGAV
jgi:hypothetical protein